MNQSQVRDTLTRNIRSVRERIKLACQRVRRQPGDVALVAVTKSVSAEVAGLLPDLGVMDLGESRPQELWQKAESISGNVCWHLIGHLQRNKIERILPQVHLIHSVDSLRLLNALEAEAAKRQQPVPILLEINASREANKHGFAPEALPDVLPNLAALEYVHIHGLMTMAAQEADPERCRPTFTELRQLRDRLKGLLEPPHRLEQLSMGMSNDFEVAIEEGATMVRIGTALFEGLQEVSQ